MFERLNTTSNNWLRLDMLRFVASAGIVWHHSHVFFYTPDVRDAVSKQTMAFALFVDLFFVLSGFIISVMYWEKIHNLGDFLHFMQRRIARLIPLHWLVLLLTWALWSIIAFVGLNSDTKPDMDLACVAHNALLLNGLFDCGTGNELTGVTWSISVEMALYLLFPILLFFSRKKYALVSIFSITLMLFISRIITLDQSLTDSLPILRGLASFLLGMVMYYKKDVLSKIKIPSFALPICLLVTIAAMSMGVEKLIVLGLIYMTAFFAVVGDLNGTARGIAAKLAPFGQLTYSIYMWHSLFILVIMNAFADKLLKLATLPMIAIAVLCYGAILLWSYWSWLYFETPARRAIDSYKFRAPALADTGK